MYVLLTCKYENNSIKTVEKTWRHRYPHYKTVGSTSGSLLGVETSHGSPVARQHVASVNSSSLIFHGTLCDLFFTLMIH